MAQSKVTKSVKKSEKEQRADMMEQLRLISDEKNIPLEKLIESIEGALISAYKRAFGGQGSVRVSADFEHNEFRVYASKLVVQRALNPNTEVSWSEAREQDPNINLGEVMEREVTPAGFGRIAALTARQVLMQKLRDAVSEQVKSEFADKQGEIFRGTVQRLERGDVIFEMQLLRAEAMLPRKEQAQGENYRYGDSLFLYVVDVRREYSRGPALIVSRTHPGLVRQLFTREVPEIAEGIVELKAVAREAGQRSKIAVWASNPDVDPVGACVGPRGNRVAKVVGELGNEKVDIVRWSPDPVQFITNALSPAQVVKVVTRDEAPAETPFNGAPGGGGIGNATVIVTDDQQSLAIGKQGQNVRLAAKLTGWRIDIRTEKQFAEEQAKRMFTHGAPGAPTPSILPAPAPTDELFALEPGDASAPSPTSSGSAPGDQLEAVTAGSVEALELDELEAASGVETEIVSADQYPAPGSAQIAEAPSEAVEAEPTRLVEPSQSSVVIVDHGASAPEASAPEASAPEASAPEASEEERTSP